MKYSKEIIEIFNNLNISTNLYEIIRFIDPLGKKVLIYEDGNLKEEKFNCYDKWERGKLCLNCTSMRAYNEKKSFTKMEHNSSNIYMVTSIPINLSGRDIVIELLRNASLNIGFGNGDMNSDMYKTIDSINNELLKDSLPNIYNRKYINELLPAYVVISNTTDQNFSVILADIDFFKKINDKYGHLIGDSILMQFTQVLTECIDKDNNWIARYGGEEFMIGVHGYTKEELIELTECMRASIEETVFSYEDIEIKITASFGIASIEDLKKPSVSKLISCVDKNLYRAKENGRNRIEY